MARDFQINGEPMVYVKGQAGSAIASLSELGLCEGPVVVTPNFKHKDIYLDAWGGMDGAPADVQWMLADMTVSMELIHFDRAILNACLALSMGGESTIGQMGRAGTRMGGGNARFVAGNNYISLNLSSPALSVPWRFFFTYLTEPPMEYPLGVEKSVVKLNWRVVPYTVDPFAAGTGAANYQLWDNVLDT